MGYRPNEFWYKITLRQANNIRTGYEKLCKNKHEQTVLEHRILARYIANAMSQKPKMDSKIYRISSDNANMESMRSIPREKVEQNLLMAFNKLSKEVKTNE
jgi:hypothetical protein